MFLFVPFRQVTILSCFLTIVLSCKQWILRRENYRTGVVLKCCAISCNPGSYVVVCTSNWTNDICRTCPEGTYMEDPTNSSLPRSCIPHECPPNSIPTDSFPLSGCQRKCRCDETNGFEGPDPCNCQHKSYILPSRKSRNENIKDSNTSSTSENFKEEKKQTKTDRFLNNTTGEDNKIYLNRKHDTPDTLLIVGGISLASVLVANIILVVVCYKRGKCKGKTLDPTSTTLTCFYQAPPNTERTQRPEARVPPYRYEEAESSNERSQPLLVPDDNTMNTLPVSQSDNHESGFGTGSNYGPHTINVQDHQEPTLETLSTLDPQTINEASSQWNGLDEYRVPGVRFEDRYHSSNYYRLSD
ncbi:uncharacterized protein LOC134239117 [Saccostrea cucullata]|uniref:uncharacterized protein LOC134239117 n=1 Tax=Saccostrea cuccullata TaxID=36930 RepID=UPI002ED4B3F2